MSSNEKVIEGLEIAKSHEKVMLFNNEEFGEIRVVDMDGESWLVGVDVAKALGYANPSKTISSRVKKAYKGITKLVTPGGEQDTTIINESGVYQLIFGSNLESADKFRDWVFEQVLPSIRKNGAYVNQQEVLSPEEIIKRGYESLLKICEEQKQKLELQKPKVEYFDALIDRDLNINLRDTAHELGIKQNDFVSYLLENNYLYRHLGKQLKPYAQHIGELFVIKEYSNDKHSGIQTLVTPKGRAYFKRIMN